MIEEWCIERVVVENGAVRGFVSFPKVSCTDPTKEKPGSIQFLQ